LTQDDRVAYWFELANYDLQTAKVMLEGKRYLYVGFMCHQVIEKALKGHYVHKSKEQPPHTHNLSVLAQKSSIYSILNEAQKDLLDALGPLNVEARYPTAKDSLLKSLTKEKCKSIIEETEALYSWIKTKS